MQTYKRKWEIRALCVYIHICIHTYMWRSLSQMASKTWENGK